MELSITVYLINFIVFIGGYLHLSSGRYSGARTVTYIRATSGVQPERLLEARER